MATAEEKEASAKGSVAASPQSGAIAASWCLAFSLPSERASYSSEVTLGASFNRRPVAGPQPAPISSTCSPKRDPDKTQGKRCRCVMRCHSEVEQKKCSKAFMVQGVGNPNCNARPDAGHALLP